MPKQAQGGREGEGDGGRSRAVGMASTFAAGGAAGSSDFTFSRMPASASVATEVPSQHIRHSSTRRLAGLSRAMSVGGGAPPPPPRDSPGGGFGSPSSVSSTLKRGGASGSPSRRRSCWLTDTTGLPIPPRTSDFVWVGALMKRRGGFGKIAANNWKTRCFVMMHDGVLCYFEETNFEAVDFKNPPRGLMSLSDDCIISTGKQDGDAPTPFVITLQGGGQRWKLCASNEEDIDRLQEAIKGIQPLARGAASTGKLDGASAVAGGSRGSAAGLRLSRQGSGLLAPEASAGKDAAPIQAPGGGDARYVVALFLADLACIAAWFLPLDWTTLALLVAAMNVVIGVGGGGRAGVDPDKLSEREVPLVHLDDVPQLAHNVKIERAKLIKASQNGSPALGDATAGLPAAGCTVQRASQPSGDLSAPQQTWQTGTSSAFKLRGKNYMQDRKKFPSEEAMYEIVAIDYFCTEARVNRVCETVILSELSKDLPTVPIQGVPPLLVINCQLPSAPPTLMSSSDDGPGYQVVLYFRIRDETLESLKDLQTAREAVSLWVNWCNKWAEDDVFKGRLKFMCYVANMEVLGLPGSIAKFNGKPALITKSGTNVVGEDGGKPYLEVDINVHRFSFIAKKGLQAVKDRFADMVLHVGFAIEGRCKEELPEGLIGCCTLNYPQLAELAELDV